MPVNPETVEQTKQQIRALVSEIAQLSKSELPPEEFYQALLQRVVQALAAVGGAVWTLDEAREPELAYQINVSDTLLDTESEDAIQHKRLLENMLRSKEPALIPPLSSTGDEAAGSNPTRYLLVMAPLVNDGQVEGILEIFQRPDAQPNTQRGYMRFLVQMCELAGDWLKTQKLRKFSDRHSLWAEADHFARLVHDSLELKDVAYTATNEGRRLIGCDRVSLAVLKGGKCVVEAISGQDTIENRANIVRALAKLGDCVTATGEPLWYDGVNDDLPPQVEEALEEYIDESYGKSIVVLPLRRPTRESASRENEPTTNQSRQEQQRRQEIIGALIIEQIESNLPREVLEPRADLIYEHTARALSNSLELKNIFLMPVWRTIGKAPLLVRARTLPKTVSVAAGLLFVILALALIPNNFNMHADGTLQPVQRAHQYVGIEGTVVEIKVKEGDFVKKDQVLAILENRDLEIRITELTGSATRLSQELDTVNHNLHDRTLSKADKMQLITERARLSTQVNSQLSQLKLLKKKKEKLVIRSTAAGQVLMSWDIEKSLMFRPVQPGQILMTVARLDGPWELELHMPEKRMGHLNSARSRLQDDLNVRYHLATNPHKTLHGTIHEVHGATNVSGDDGSGVKIRVTINQEDLVEPRPGATCSAQVYCGKRAMGYCWFHEMFEFVQSKILFRLF